MMRAMVAVDEPHVRDLVTIVFQTWGYEVDAVTDCREVANLKPDAGYSLYLIAAALPDGSSFDVCRQLRTLSHGAPIVVVDNRNDDVSLAVEAGAKSFVIRGTSLVALLIQMLNRISDR